MRISELGEFGLIDRIAKILPAAGPDVLVSIGDDVAVLRVSENDPRVWLATCDSQIEGSHFVRQSVIPELLGRKALAINQSDIASKGGRPRFALVSLGLPEDLEVVFVDELYKGMRAQAEEFSTDIIGGNISRSRLGLIVDITLLGDALKENLLMRSGAHPGDKILVTGTLGDAAAGLALVGEITSSVSPEYARRAESRFRTPTPRVREGELIGASHLATAMMDISDGLANDLGHICERSRVSARLYAESLPVDRENRKLAQALRRDEWYFGLYGGEDYELLFTAPPPAANKLADEIMQATGTRVTIIGDILASEEGRQFVLPGGRMSVLQAGGWDHLKSNAGQSRI